MIEYISMLMCLSSDGRLIHCPTSRPRYITVSSPQNCRVEGQSLQSGNPTWPNLVLRPWGVIDGSLTDRAVVPTVRESHVKRREMLDSSYAFSLQAGPLHGSGVAGLADKPLCTLRRSPGRWRRNLGSVFLFTRNLPSEIAESFNGCKIFGQV
jgi:hypothetical protein